MAPLCYANEVYQLILEETESRFYCLPVMVDIAIPYELGLTPREVAKALVGKDKSTMKLLMENSFGEDYTDEK